MSQSKTLGVVIGRFQIHELHEGHIWLLDHVASRHEDLLILLGCTTVRFNTSDPYPFEIRKQMLKSRYPQATILKLMDSPISEAKWSQDVDAYVGAVAGSASAILYGSRDSFIPKYVGRFSTEEVPAFTGCSGTLSRQEAGNEYVNDPMFRLGWLAAIQSQFTVTDPTVDMAIHTADFSKVLMGRRGKGSPLRFFGGFVDPEDESYEEAAMRERSEEALGITVKDPLYIGSRRIRDPRYGRTKYGIMTTFFSMEYVGGKASAGDDMGVVQWCKLHPRLLPRVSKTHHGLYQMLLAFKEKQLSERSRS